ncbi:camp-regulated phospho protein/endosulfine conserved region-domain-containing protein [Protomyces lactucae-debilis]|uniref:mRNA stability protein n=1 Tax=Protomyces lactucae-debilis TaxID=2754530 RepID=A0A1Y2FGR8_PROLT|nr:camp-regulated phospho protein/endosulfine conserved region-domain-containing protein [Protomyces lactucae-debilis]ORY83122.1 camp-regulated phospho protein/endosulfine conserved region-domain-containing protein [Protomyces lactucae-debilis]
MNPLQAKKVDISTLNEEERKLLSKYGKLPQRKDLLSNKLKERKYFDSGDYALSQAGKASDAGITHVGSQFPSPETIPHSPHASQQHMPPGTGAFTGPGSSSPVKESSLLNEDSVPSQSTAAKAIAAEEQAKQARQ